MKVAILAGGYGTRIGEETVNKPKPMIEIGGKPLLWHIMKHYSYFGYKEFVVLLGYKGYYIKEYFANYFLHQSDVTIDIANNSVEVHNSKSEDWKITLVDTGLDTMTGGRILRAREYFENQPFMMTYGDGLSNVNIDELVQFHKNHGKMVTLTKVQPEGRFGALDFEQDGKVLSFREKPQGDGAWINGGFFVCQPEIFDHLEGDSTIFEREPLEKLATKDHLYSFPHSGFWKCMDTLRDKEQMEKLWNKGAPPWTL